MNCLFCNHQLQKSENAWTALTCENHPPLEVVFYHNEDDHNIVDYYVIRNNEHEVCVYTNPPSEGPHDHVFFLSKVKGKYTSIYSSSKIPPINPDNFLNKIKTMLVFI